MYVYIYVIFYSLIFQMISVKKNTLQSVIYCYDSFVLNNLEHVLMENLSELRSIYMQW